MSKRLKIDKHFIPCPIDDNDEIYQNGIFHFNITRMLEYIHNHQDLFQVEEVMVCDFIKQHSKINEAHVDSVDISIPVILAEIAPGRYNVIDGNHRMEKAHRLGVEKICAYRLDVEQHIRFLTEKRAYLSYVEYWNESLEVTHGTQL